MAVVNRRELGRELMRTLSQVDRQMRKAEEEASKQNISAYCLKDTNGNYVLPSLLSAKAQLLHGLTLINKKDD
jgi:hypothetical protein